MDWESTPASAGEAFLIVDDLPPSATPDDIRLLLELYPVVSIDIRIAAHTVGSSEIPKCSALVKLPSSILAEDAKRYLKELRSSGTWILDRPINAYTGTADGDDEVEPTYLADPGFGPLPSISRRRISPEAYYLFGPHPGNDENPGPDRRDVMISNLPRACSEEDILSLLEGYEPDDVLIIPIDDSIKYAWVTMKTAKDAKLALICLTGTMFRGHPLVTAYNVYKEDSSSDSIFERDFIGSESSSALLIDPSNCTLDELIEWAHACKQQQLTYPTPWPYPIVCEDKYQEFARDLKVKLADWEEGAARRALEITPLNRLEMLEMAKLGISAPCPMSSSTSEEVPQPETSLEEHADPLGDLDKLSLGVDEPRIETQGSSHPVENHAKPNRRVKPAKPRRMEHGPNRAARRAKSGAGKAKKDVRRPGQGHLPGLDSRPRLERSRSPSPSSHYPSSPRRKYRQREPYFSPPREQMQPRQERCQSSFTAEAQWMRWDAEGDLNIDLHGRISDEHTQYWARRDWTDRPGKDDWPCVFRGWKV